jgi:hypothetical protein
MAKLESELGLTESRTKKSSQAKVLPLSEDKYLLPQRWVTDMSIATTEEFIRKNQNGGVNQLAKTTFRILIVLNVLLRFTGVALLILEL